jgi:hypothetical protein
MSQGRVYTVSFTATAVTAQIDVFEVTPADDKPIEVLGYEIGQSSDFGDAQAEQLGFRVIRGFTTSGSGGAAATPSPLTKNGDTASGFAAETCNTTLANTGTTIDLHAGAINLQAGSGLVWLPEGCEWGCSQADTRLVFRFIAAPADSITLSGTLYVREQG